VPQIGGKWIAVGSGQGALAAIGVAQSTARDPGFQGSVAGAGLGAAAGGAGLKPTQAPLLVISSQVDPAAEKIVDRMCKLGDRVLFLRYGDEDASGAMGNSVGDQLSWIKARLDGHSAPGNCPQATH